MQKRLQTLVLFLVLTLSATVALAAAGGNGKGNGRNVNDNDTVPVKGNVHPNARPEFDAGPTNANLRLEKMVLVLAPRPDTKISPDQLLMQLHDRSSALYHQWLTPEQYGAQFGISDS